MKQTLFYTQTINDLFTHADLVLNLTKSLFFVHLTTLPDFPLKKTVDIFHNDFGGIEFIILTPFVICKDTENK